MSSVYRSSWVSPAPIDDYFSSGPAPGTPKREYIDFGEHLGPREDTGTPTAGIYANDGLWDEEDSEISTAQYSSSNAVSTATSIKTRGGSMKSRSNRSGTASPFPQEEEKSGLWGWKRKGRESHVAEKSPEVPKVLTKKESKAKLRGKGRRGELVVVVDPENVSCKIPKLGWS
jgi:hypothetical protein